MITQRTPQQASIEAKEAREAWELGKQIEVKLDYPDYGLKQDWRMVEKSDRVSFSDPGCYWRVAKPTPPVITPGKWRTRAGNVVEVQKRAQVPNENQYQFTSNTSKLFYLDNGRVFNNQETNDDLISRVETKWRPWRPEEVPMLRILVSKTNRADKILAGASLPNHPHIRQKWFSDYELLLPDGTYAPCGVEEVVG